jgi:hypothetical protein
MIEFRSKWRFGLAVIRVAGWLARRGLHCDWLFWFGVGRVKGDWRLNKGPWLSYKSQAHVNAVRLYGGRHIDGQ